jgi:hypothetical protein
VLGTWCLVLGCDGFWVSHFKLLSVLCLVECLSLAMIRDGVVETIIKILSESFV